MKSDPALPDACWLPIRTRRVRQAEVLWASDIGTGISSPRFDPEQIFCLPVSGEPVNAYSQDSRTEWVDRYGGIGIGASGGSGRCSTFNGIQCKGVGPTPLVAPDADPWHSSGTLGHVEAASEALYSEVYRWCLPFGAVPVLALVTIGTHCVPRHDHEAKSPRPLRTLLYRPFEPRPAHFLRNPQRFEASRPSDIAAGWTEDSARTSLAMAGLAAHMHVKLNLHENCRDKLACLDSGLRELSRRLAWQAAAAFAKRIPHGSLSPSNLGLSAEYLDFGLSSFIPEYQRLGWTSWSDPWEEINAPPHMLGTLRQQLNKYHPACSGDAVVSEQDLAAIYATELSTRLRVEFAKMAGLTEDLAEECPSSLLDHWVSAMVETAKRGSGDRHVPFSGCMADGSKTPAGEGRYYRLSAALRCLWRGDGPSGQDAALAPFVPDAALRSRLLTGATEVLAVFANGDPALTRSVSAYLDRQAVRKNEPMDFLHREAFARDCALELDGSPDMGRKLSSLLSLRVSRARHVLSDLDPELCGDTGREQMAFLASPQFLHSRRSIQMVSSNRGASMKTRRR